MALGAGLYEVQAPEHFIAAGIGVERVLIACDAEAVLLPAPNGLDAFVIDGNGVVYANSEDGNLFALKQGGTLKQEIFQQLALGAAYTPTSIGSDGKIYSQNAGHLFVAGN